MDGDALKKPVLPTNQKSQSKIGDSVSGLFGRKVNIPRLIPRLAQATKKEPTFNVATSRSLEPQTLNYEFGGRMSDGDGMYDTDNFDYKVKISDEDIEEYIDWLEDEELKSKYYGDDDDRDEAIDSVIDDDYFYDFLHDKYEEEAQEAYYDGFGD